MDYYSYCKQHEITNQYMFNVAKPTAADDKGRGILAPSPLTTGYTIIITIVLIHTV